MMVTELMEILDRMPANATVMVEVEKPKTSANAGSKTYAGLSDVRLEGPTDKSSPHFLILRGIQHLVAGR